MINFKFQLALPMNKDSVIIKSQGTGKKLKFFTPEGYKDRNAFIKWIQSKGITEQIWYDRYYLNILLDSQRPRCKYKDCNNYVTFNYSKSNGYEYSEFCCHSCCQKNNWDRNNGESRNKLSKTNKQKYIDDESLRHKKSEETKEGFRKSGAYDLDENGKNRFSNSKLNFYKTEEGKDAIRRRSLKMTGNEKLSKSLKLAFSKKEVKERMSKSVKESMTPEHRRFLSQLRKDKFRNDPEFREKQLNILRSRKIKGYRSEFIYSRKCLNSLDGYVYCDSSYEIAYILSLELDDSVEWFSKEPRDLNIEYTHNSEIHWYWPDFIVKYKSGEIYLIEIKPKNLINNDNVISKKEAAEKWCKENGMEYRILTEDDIFVSVSKESSIEVYNYYRSLRIGFLSNDESVRKLLENNIK